MPSWRPTAAASIPIAARCASRTSTSARSRSARSRPSDWRRRSTRSCRYSEPMRRCTRRSARISPTTSTSPRPLRPCTCTATRCATGWRAPSRCSGARSSSRRRLRRSTSRLWPKRPISASRRPKRRPEFGAATVGGPRGGVIASALVEGTEQPTAPYLDAVGAYAFRGPGRYHVPGHKGGPGADPGLRKTIGVDALAADVPQDIHGIDLGPSPTPYERAEKLAADAFGAGRTFFLTNGATQGNHTLCLALAPLGARIVAQRNSHASIVDGLVLSGGIPSFVAPEYDDELGITHCVTPDALAVALAEAPDAQAA